MCYIPLLLLLSLPTFLASNKSTEAQDSYGGTWYTHRYPGIRSDSDLYTFGYSFKPWVGPPIDRTRYSSVAWLPDGTGFYYTRYPGNGRVPAGEEHYHRSIYFHALGTDPDLDPLVFKPEQKEH